MLGGVLQMKMRGERMRTTTYHNAKNVLPPGLLAEVQRHFSGHLWVPTAEPQAVRLRQRIVQLHQAGMGTSKIADMVGISQRRVQQIVRAAKQGDARHAE
jgi:predicted transcriptional regulator